MEFTEELPCWAVILSGLGLVAAGIAWRMIVDARSKDDSKPRDYQHEETGMHRNSYVLVMVGLVWAGYGVFQCL